MIATITIPSIHYLALLSVFTFFGASLVLLVLSAIVTDKVRISVATMVTSLASIAVMVYAAFEWAYIAHHGATTTVAHAIVLDGFAVVGKFAQAA